MKTYNYEVIIIKETSQGHYPCQTMKQAEDFIAENYPNNEYKITYKGKIIVWKGKVLDSNTGLWVKSS